MWFLHTSRAELKFFTAPEDVGKYAVLSHVWGDHEDTFQDLERINKECVGTDKNPRDLVSDKVRKLCELAEKHELEYAWVDTCCIDKTNPTEMSETLNAMYRLYSHSVICYAFLSDVPTPENHEAIICDDSPFRNSRWHTRGWTLPELIAPPFVRFVSSSWVPFSSKLELSGLLETITTVPQDVLRGQKQCSDFSVSRRMAWASSRQTTRPEDQAYCLMGLFTVYTPAMYGGRSTVFRRVQQAIWESSYDCSLFVWGRSASATTISRGGNGAEMLAPPACSDRAQSGSAPLFAPSPESFGMAISATTIFSMPDFHAVLDAVTPPDSMLRHTAMPQFTSTPRGVRAFLPIVENPFGIPVTIALLCCRTSDPTEQAVGLVLFPCPRSDDPRRPLYHCGSITNPHSVRLLRFNFEELLRLKVEHNLRMREIYIGEGYH